MKYISLILIIFFASCGTSKYAIRDKENIENMKELAYCKCLTFAIQKFVGKDSLDISNNNANMYFEYIEWYYVKKILPVLDSAAESISIEEAKHRFNKGPGQVAEGVNGKVEYKMDCLNFYKSKQLDSLVRAMNRKLNDSISGDERDNYKLMLKK
jgi:hypothetical protein